MTLSQIDHVLSALFLAISEPESDAVHLLAEQVVAILPDFLGGPLPNAKLIMEAGIFSSMTLCDDYMAEIDHDEFVDKSLKDHGIFYSRRWNPQSGP